MSAGALCFSQGRLLLVNPTYKALWEIPGGLVEEGESPRAACERELREELGVAVPVGRLLGVDYRTGPRYGEGLHFIFDGGEFDAARIAALRLDPAELSECRWVAVDEVAGLVAPNLARRAVRCAAARVSGATLYLEDGTPRP
ncbi:MAG: NUDIX hydrolase [Chloroflexi bacterium]|nr:NUDIX hydrolase [Chloroflexota bacterium]